MRYGNIIVVNKKTHQKCSHDVYVGRPSPLGNPYAMTGEGMRSEVIEQYTKWLIANLGDQVVKTKLDMIGARLQVGLDVHLVCWCAPLPCHADIIKQYIEVEYLKKKKGA